MKKVICALLALLMLLPFCSFAEPVILSASVEGSIFSGAAGTSLPVTVSFDPALFTDNTVFHNDIAKLAALLSADVYFREKDLKKGTQNRVVYEGEEEYAVTNLLSALGFSDVTYIESFKTGLYETDTNDSVTMLLGHMETEEKDLFAVVIRGSFSVGEWLSAFDPGAVSPQYGDHPEWTDTRAHKGFSVAASRAFSFFSEYRAAHGSPRKPDAVLVTGHSRGGSVAGLLGAMLEKDDTLSPFTYTFSAAPETADPAAREARTVFNLFDSGDFFTNAFPFAEDALYRTGTDFALPMAEMPEALSAAGALMPGYAYLAFTPEMQEEYAARFAARFPSRASLYEPVLLEESFKTGQEAAAREAEMLMLIGSEGGLGLEGLVSAERNGTNVTLSYSGAALMAALAKSLAYGDAAFEAFLNLFGTDREACAVASFLQENQAAVSLGHRILDSFVLADVFHRIKIAAM